MNNIKKEKICRKCQFFKRVILHEIDDSLKDYEKLQAKNKIYQMKDDFKLKYDHFAVEDVCIYYSTYMPYPWIYYKLCKFWKEE